MYVVYYKDSYSFVLLFSLGMVDTTPRAIYRNIVLIYLM